MKRTAATQLQLIVAGRKPRLRVASYRVSCEITQFSECWQYFDFFYEVQTLPTTHSLGITLAGGLSGYNLKFKMMPTFLALLEFDANQENGRYRRVL